MAAKEYINLKKGGSGFAVANGPSRALYHPLSAPAPEHLFYECFEILFREIAANRTHSSGDVSTTYFERSIPHF